MRLSRRAYTGIFLGEIKKWNDALIACWYLPAAAGNPSAALPAAAATLMNEQVDFGASDAAMQDAELAQMDNSALMIPMTGGCVAPCVQRFRGAILWRLVRAAPSRPHA